MKKLLTLSEGFNVAIIGAIIGGLIAVNSRTNLSYRGLIAAFIIICLLILAQFVINTITCAKILNADGKICNKTIGINLSLNAILLTIGIAASILVIQNQPSAGMCTLIFAIMGIFSIAHIIAFKNFSKCITKNSQ